MADMSEFVELSIEGYPNAVQIGAGGNAFATVQTGFEQPAVSGTVDVHVDSARWCVVGQWVVCTTGGLYTVSAILDQWHVRLVNMGLPGNASPATPIGVGSKISPSGTPGSAAGGVDFTAVKAALQAATSDVDMNDWGFTTVRVVKFNSTGPNIAVDAISGGPIIGQETLSPGQLYLRAPTGGRWGFYTAAYVPVMSVGDDGVASMHGNRLRFVGTAVDATDAFTLADYTARASNTAGSQVTNAAGGAGVSAAYSRSDHSHQLNEAAVRTVISTAAGPVAFNNQNITGVNDLTATRLILNGVGAVAELSGSLLFGNNGFASVTMRASTLWQVQIGGGSPGLAVRTTYVGMSVPVQFEQSVAAGNAYYTQVAPGAGVNGHEISYLGQVAGSGAAVRGGRPRLANGTPGASAIRDGAAMGLLSSAGAFTPVVECAEVGAGKVLVALGEHTAIGAQADPGVNVVQLAAGSFGADNPPAGQAYMIWDDTAKRVKVKDSGGTVYTATMI